MNDDRESWAKMVAGAMREGGILVAVFGWLDKAVHGEPFFGPWGWTVTLAALGLFFGGGIIERRRGPR